MFSGYLIRLLIILPQLVLATIGLEWVCAVFFRKISFNKFRPRFKGVSKDVGLFLLIFMIMGISSLPKYVYYINRENDQRSIPMVFEWEKDFTWLKSNSDGEDIILSDPWTSYYIPYFAERKIVAIPPGHSPTFPIDDRVSDALLMLNMSTPLDETLKLIKKYNVSHVLLNLRPFLDTKFEGYRQYIEIYYSTDTPSKFQRASNFFKEVYYFNGVWIYEVL